MEKGLAQGHMDKQSRIWAHQKEEGKLSLAGSPQTSPGILQRPSQPGPSRCGVTWPLSSLLTWTRLGIPNLSEFLKNKNQVIRLKKKKTSHDKWHFQDQKKIT